MPRDHETIATLRQSITDLHTVINRWTRARTNIHDFTGIGYPTTSGGGSSNSGTSNPVLATITNLEIVDTHPNHHGEHLGWRTDNIARDLAEADARIEQIRLNTIWLDRFVTRYTETVPAHWAPATCTICSTAGRTSTVYADDRCRWHYDFRNEWGEDACTELTITHLDRPARYVTEKLIRRLHPDAHRRTDRESRDVAG